MDYNRIATYLRSLESYDNKLINDIEAFGIEQGIPIAKRETVSFLQTMIKLKNPKSILEVGTAIGYSTILMALASSANVTSIERNEENFKLASSYVNRAIDEGLVKEGQIKLIYGDATDVLKKLDSGYDMIFMDAAKGQYPIWLPEIIRLLSDNGILISDNVFQDETIFESKFSLERRERTIHKRMRDYLYELKHNEALTTSIMPLGDGVALSVKTK